MQRLDAGRFVGMIGDEQPPPILRSFIMTNEYIPTYIPVEDEDRLLRSYLGGTVEQYEEWDKNSKEIGFWELQAMAHYEEHKAQERAGERARVTAQEWAAIKAGKALIRLSSEDMAELFRSWKTRIKLDEKHRALLRRQMIEEAREWELKKQLQSEEWVMAVRASRLAKEEDARRLARIRSGEYQREIEQKKFDAKVTMILFIVGGVVVMLIIWAIVGSRMTY